MILLAIIAVTAIVTGGLTGSVAAGVVIGVLAAGVYYWRDVRRHPLVACRVCSGGGAEKSQIARAGSKLIRNPFGDCWCCGGRKVHPRPALRFLDSGQYKRIKAEITRAKGKH